MKPDFQSHRCERDRNFLNKIIKTDETWVHFYEPEDKRSSMVWKHSDSLPPKKAKTVKSMGKVMCIMFIDRCFWLFDLILYVPSTIFSLCLVGSSWVEPVLN